MTTPFAPPLQYCKMQGSKKMMFLIPKEGAAEKWDADRMLLDLQREARCADVCGFAG